MKKPGKPELLTDNTSSTTNSSIVISNEQWCQQAGATKKQLNALMERGLLPEFTYNFPKSRFKGWHTAVLKEYALLKMQKDIEEAEITKNEIAMAKKSGAGAYADAMMQRKRGPMPKGGVRGYLNSLSK